ncbi:MAG: hypothetical protein BGO37_10870 [Cellulomonas sp. 73-92]|uniref:hypothetical protein n=1 Tax=Cellulomonas sp. 73-92 TaxID=1895740 RepID=UPI00092946BB|nr:hypothetical protein [Cellulomonas sp. 73-92]OJV76543.1 MAG: hypothetical protein BGO37_10870 [Cellulomonas sp. 73-92]
MAPTATTAPQRYMQGIAIPATSVNPTEFFARTRRKTQTEKSIAWNGQSNDTIELRKSDILSSLLVRFSGSLVVTPGTGSVASLRRWPYDLLKLVRYTANGAANIISVSGAKLKARDLMKHTDLSDRGVSQAIGAGTVTQGTLARASESWGVGSGVSALANGTYSVELEWSVPVAEDEIQLMGASFLATSSSDLTLSLDYSPLTELFATTGNGTVALTGTVQVISTKFSIPIGSDGQIVVPDLSVFHSLIQNRTTALQNGVNEVRLVGQGAGKSLLRVYGQIWNGAPTAPVQLSTTNFGKIAWAYGGAEVPEEYPDGNAARIAMERIYNDDLGGQHGFFGFDFAAESAFRDVVDTGTTADLRLQFTLQNGLTLSSPGLEYVTEHVYMAGQAA